MQLSSAAALISRSSKPWRPRLARWPRASGFCAVETGVCVRKHYSRLTISTCAILRTSQAMWGGRHRGFPSALLCHKFMGFSKALCCRCQVAMFCCFFFVWIIVEQGYRALHWTSAFREDMLQREGNVLLLSSATHEFYHAETHSFCPKSLLISNCFFRMSNWINKRFPHGFAAMLEIFRSSPKVLSEVRIWRDRSTASDVCTPIETHICYM